MQTGLTNPAAILELEPDLSSAAMLERLRTMLRYELIERLPRATPTAAVHYRLTTRGGKILRMLNLIEQLDDEPANPEQSIQDYLGTTAAPKPALIPPSRPVPTNRTTAVKNGVKIISAPSTNRLRPTSSP